MSVPYSQVPQHHPLRQYRTARRAIADITRSVSPTVISSSSTCQRPLAFQYGAARSWRAGFVVGDVYCSKLLYQDSDCDSRVHFWTGTV
eukprot:1786742-Rhodomonas_salina.3